MPTHLSPTELIVLKHCWLGQTYKEIAALLGISYRTVAVHLFNARRRLGATTNTQACRLAVEQGILVVATPTPSSAS